MKQIEVTKQDNKQAFVEFYNVTKSGQGPDLANLVGHTFHVPCPVRLEHRELFEKDGEAFCLVAQIYANKWPTEEALREFAEWCDWHGLKWKEFINGYSPEDGASWYNPESCRVLVVMKNPNAGIYLN